MRVLFLAPKYMDLYKNILNELNRLDVETVFIEDVPQKYNYRFRYKHSVKESIRNILYYIKSLLYVNWREYWSDRLNSIDNLYFDKLFVINGFSYNKYLLETLRRFNNNIETYLYLWDNLYAYNFSYIINDFDHCYTLDFQDAVNKEKLNFLPAFWVPSDSLFEDKSKYDVFMIGTNHDDRYLIATSVIKQIKKNGLTCFIKLVDKNLPEDEIITHKFFPTVEYLKLMRQSRCVLDTERPSQTGPTVRLVWALSLGKKIISTNAHMKEMPFYNPNQICIIDRNSPQLDIDFINNEVQIEISDYIQNLRVDNWISKVLNIE